MSVFICKRRNKRFRISALKEHRIYAQRLPPSKTNLIRDSLHRRFVLRALALKFFDKADSIEWRSL